jgi:replicative DNA helicase
MTTEHDDLHQVVTRFLASLMSPGITPQGVLTPGQHLQPTDLPDARDSAIWEAIRACAVDGQTGPELVLARLREGGHLQRDVDRRIGERLMQITTTTADPLQASALAAEILDRAEVRVMESVARDILERAATLPTADRRDMMRAFWARFRDVTERLDATVGRAGGHTEGRAHLRDVSA